MAQAIGNGVSPMDHLETIANVAGYLVTIAGFIAMVVKNFKDQKQVRKEQEKIRDGQKCQLRAYMLQVYHDNKEKKALRQYEAENFVMMYRAYKAMGGNSFIDEIYDHVTKWELEI